MRNTMGANASGGLEVVGSIGGGDGRPRRLWARREEVLAGTVLRRPHLGHGVSRSAQRRLVEHSAARGVGPLRQPVCAHATGEGERGGLRSRGDGRRRSAASRATAAAAGRKQRENDDRDDGSGTRAHTVRNASVGDMRAARTAGSSPAIAPIRTAAPRPPAHAVVGMAICQCLVAA